MNDANRRLQRSFFEADTCTVARRLLGKRLVRRLSEGVVSVRLVELEAYVGTEDSACHASHGKTARTAPMFGPPGFAYIYFSYGMHWLLNVVTEPEGKACAVLIRAAEPLENQTLLRQNRPNVADSLLCSGPACLCKALQIDGALRGCDMVEGDSLYFEQDAEIPEELVLRRPRVGIGYAREEDQQALWRFSVIDSPSVSKAKAKI